MCEYCDLMYVEVRTDPITELGVGKDMGGVHIEDRYGKYRLVTDQRVGKEIMYCPMCGKLL